MLAVAFGLGAALTWGIADFLGGITSRRLHVVVVLLGSQLIGAALIVAALAVRGQGPPAAEYLLYGALGGVAGLVGLAAFYRGMAIGAIAVVAPISATGAAIPVAVGVATGDRPSAVQVVGLVLALVGVVLASRTGGEGSGAKVAAGTGLALVAALGFGGFFVGIDAAGDGDVLWALLAARSIDIVLLVVIAVAVVRPSLDLRAPDLRVLAAIGVLEVVANGLFALASKTGLVSLAAVLASLYPVVTILLAWVVLKERVRRSQAVGVAIALGGVVAIAGG